MLTLETSIAFFSVSVVLGLSPGPDNIFVLTQSALRGPRAGLLVTLGLCTGLIVHTTLVAFGVAAIFQASDIAFNALKIAGAAYLLWLAWQAFRAPASAIRLGEGEGPSATQLYRRGIVMNITNPKVSVFFLAFLPQFADPARGPISMQMLLLGGLFILATLLVFGGVALTAGALGRRLGRSARAQLVMNRVAGTVFALLALKLATSSR
ncbi:LysE family translocator [Noviherbaspirillum aridicola]|uniref:Membrane protein n=1 Tax=Noviherbaspirillum aridicola TaxID=2849687 RepID=A0ABQ4Q486_9BURK|nr:LysE family translocator [Noviherbaspirillum aridicola]GIZ51821.1 membrane protein [Noviherbaspirillum aridicola]